MESNCDFLLGKAWITTVDANTLSPSAPYCVRTTYHVVHIQMNKLVNTTSMKPSHLACLAANKSSGAAVFSETELQSNSCC